MLHVVGTSSSKAFVGSRLIDKARAAQEGTLGSYFFGQSPFDRAMLNALGLGYRSFARIVAAAPDDASVIAALRACNPASLERARSWSATLETKHRWFMNLLDLDDGYERDSLGFIRPAVHGAAAAISWIVKRAWPSHVKQQEAIKAPTNL